MAATSEIADVFGESAATPLGMARAILNVHRAAFETEHKLSVDHADSGEISVLPWSFHAGALDAVGALIRVAEILGKEI